jgi:predicted nucleic acid-binding protein
VSLDAIEDGASVFIDANVFIYHFGGASEQCTRLLARCESLELGGFTSAAVVAEVCHRLMMIEAVEKKLVAGGNVSKKLARRPDLVRRLSTYDANVEAIGQMSIEIAAVTEETLAHAIRLQRRHGLLTNDSILVAAMQQRAIHLLATADRRLGMVSGIETAVPTDLR